MTRRLTPPLRLRALASPALLLALLLASAAGWTGPRIAVAHKNGIAQLEIDGVAHPAVWPNLNVVLDMQAHPTWQPAAGQNAPPNTTFDATVVAAAAAGIDLINMCITGDCCLEEALHQTPWYSEAHPMPNTSTIFFDRAIELNPRAKFILRLYVQQPDRNNTNLPGQKPPFGGKFGDLDDVTLVNFNGSVVSICDHDDLNSRMNSITDRWVAEGRRRLRALLRYMDRKYPGRIAGVFFTGLQTGEFDYPIVDNDVGPDGKLDYKTRFYADYSEGVRESFCARYPPAQGAAAAAAAAAGGGGGRGGRGGS